MSVGPAMANGLAAGRRRSLGAAGLAFWLLVAVYAVLVLLAALGVHAHRGAGPVAHALCWTCVGYTLVSLGSVLVAAISLWRLGID